MGVATDAVRNIIIWGNHSSTQFPDVAHATVTTTSGTTGVYEAVKDDAWLKGDFITVCHVLCNCITLSLSLSLPLLIDCTKKRCCHYQST